MDINNINIEDFITYGRAKKPFEDLSPEEYKEVTDRVQKEIRQEAWPFGLPVYYGINGLVIAEYENGKKMIVETVNGERVETREYEGDGKG